MLIQFNTKFKQFINFNLNSDVVVRNVLLRESKALGNHFPDLVVLKVDEGSFINRLK